MGNCGSFRKLCHPGSYAVHSNPGFMSASRHSLLPHEAVDRTEKAATSRSWRMPCSVHRYKSNGAPWIFSRKGALITRGRPAAASYKHYGCEVRSQDVLENLLYDDEIELTFSQWLPANVVIRIWGCDLYAGGFGNCSDLCGGAAELREIRQLGTVEGTESNRSIIPIHHHATPMDPLAGWNHRSSRSSISPE